MFDFLWLQKTRSWKFVIYRLKRPSWNDQCVIENDNKFFPILEKSKPESVLKINGKVVKRASGTEILN